MSAIAAGAWAICLTRTKQVPVSDHARSARFVAGAVAGYVYDLDNKLASFHIGLSLPLLLETGAKRNALIGDQ
jgi:hypothetical protein